MTAVARAVKLCGGPAMLARRLNVSVQAVCFWRDGARAFPLELAATLEGLTGGVVTRFELRPSDWHLIWPELIGTPGAPAVPQPLEVRDAA